MPQSRCRRHPDTEMSYSLDDVPFCPRCRREASQRERERIRAPLGAMATPAQAIEDAAYEDKADR